jgi:hypothetical protein
VHPAMIGVTFAAEVSIEVHAILSFAGGTEEDCIDGEEPP